MKTGDVIKFSGSFSLETYSQETGTLEFNPESLVLVINNKTYCLKYLDEENESMALIPISE